MAYAAANASSTAIESSPTDQTATSLSPPVTPTPTAEPTESPGQPGFGPAQVLLFVALIVLGRQLKT